MSEEAQFMPFRLLKSVWDKYGNLIRSVDALFDTFGQDLHDLDIRFPEIVVVGSESVGKSSLLEKIAGMTIFPRGEGITTRFPFRLRLHHCTEEDMRKRTDTIPEDQVYRMYDCPVLIRFDGDSSYLPHPDLVRKRVQEQNEIVEKSKLGFHEKELVLNMYSQSFPSLTLLDLPGLLAAKGPDDPEDIVEKGRGIVSKKIENDDAIILAVLNARSNIRGTAAGLHLIQQAHAELRTLVVLTCVDRTDKDDRIPAIMRQLPELGLPKFGHHYHAVIGRDLHRTASTDRANPVDCDNFLKAVADLEDHQIQEYLDKDLISEQALQRALTIISLRASSNEDEKVKQIEQSITQCLDRTRVIQENFEDRYFEQPKGSELSEWQKQMKVDPALLAPDLLDYLGSQKLAGRLSDMLARHIGLTWAPKMEKKVKECRDSCEALLAACGPVPPTPEQRTAALGYAKGLVECFLQLLDKRTATLTASVASECKNQVMNDSTWGSFAPFSPSIPNWQCAQASAGSVVQSYGVKVLDAVKACLSEDASESRLHRFPAFRAWVSAMASQVVDKKLAAAQKMLGNLFAALAPEIHLPSQHPTLAALHSELVQTVVAVLPRIIHAQLLGGLTESLRRALASAALPIDSGEDGGYLLREEDAHVARRGKIVSQLTALAQFTAALGVIVSEQRREEFAAQVASFRPFS